MPTSHWVLRQRDENIMLVMPSGSSQSDKPRNNFQVRKCVMYTRECNSNVERVQSQAVSSEFWEAGDE